MLKRAVEQLLASGLAPFQSRRNRGGVLVLAYHNVVPAGASPVGDRSLHLSRKSFGDQLDVLQDRHCVVSLEDVIRPGDGTQDEDPGRADRPDRRLRVVITFDDAYRGAMTCGLDELSRRGLPATVFVSPGTLGADGFWWDKLAMIQGSTGDGTKGGDGSSARRLDREFLIEEKAGRGSTILSHARRVGRPFGPAAEHARPVSEDELVRSARRPGVTFGAHGWSHANLAQLSDGELRQELTRPLRWLREKLGDAALPALAYPYGRYSACAGDAARRAGYRAAFTVDGGPFEPKEEDRLFLPRTNIPAGVSLDGFRLRLMGQFS